MPVALGRRDAVLDAAVQVLGTGGSRALTHRAVDRAGGLPEGTSSNHFRTRDALVVGVLSRISQVESQTLDGLLPPGSPALELEAVVAAAGAHLRFLLGAGRTHTIARHALFLEAALHPELRPGLEELSRFWWALIARMLAGLGVPDAERRGRWLLAYFDGLLADQLARPEAEFDPEAAVRAALLGLLAA